MDFNPQSGARNTATEQGKDSEAVSSDGFSFSKPFQSFLATTREVIFQPVGFFSRLSRNANIAGAFAFALICMEVGFSLIYTLQTGIFSSSLGLTGLLVLIVFMMMVMLITSAVLLFLGAIILHLLVVVLVNAGRLSWDSGFWATFKVTSYACVTLLVGWIPIIGPLLMLYSIYIVFAGLLRMHRRPQVGMR